MPLVYFCVITIYFHTKNVPFYFKLSIRNCNDSNTHSPVINIYLFSNFQEVNWVQFYLVVRRKWRWAGIDAALDRVAARIATWATGIAKSASTTTTTTIGITVANRSPGADIRTDSTTRGVTLERKLPVNGARAPTATPNDPTPIFIAIHLRITIKRLSRRLKMRTTSFSLSIRIQPIFWPGLMQIIWLVEEAARVSWSKRIVLRPQRRRHVSILIWRFKSMFWNYSWLFELKNRDVFFFYLCCALLFSLVIG